MSDPADIGIIGLGVMGGNLARNIAEHGFRVAVHDRDPDRLGDLVSEEHGAFMARCPSVSHLIQAIRPPRPVIMMVPAGDATANCIEELAACASDGDILIDAGNSDFHDTRRRTAALEARGLAFLGMGVSGGAEGARRGPAIMAGGSQHVWERVAPILSAIAAQFEGEPCAAWLGPDGAGHFVKTIHNGIEYADMQMIAEVYGVLRDGLGKTPAEIGPIFEAWRDGPLQSYLIDCAAAVAAARDPETGRPMLDIIADRAGQKGTGRWSVIEATRLGAPVSTMAAALDARNLSGMTETRQRVHRDAAGCPPLGTAVSLDDLHDALLFGKIAAYAQGLAALRAASEAYAWSLDLSRVVTVWRAGCIIRAGLLNDLMRTLQEQPDRDIMTADPFVSMLQDTLPATRRLCSAAVLNGLPTPALISALQHYEQLSRPRGTTNMIQGMRDFFGQHGFERIDRADFGHHGDWETRER